MPERQTELNDEEKEQLIDNIVNQCVHQFIKNPFAGNYGYTMISDKRISPEEMMFVTQTVSVKIKEKVQIISRLN